MEPINFASLISKILRVPEIRPKVCKIPEIRHETPGIPKSGTSPNRVGVSDPPDSQPLTLNYVENHSSTLTLLYNRAPNANHWFRGIAMQPESRQAETKVVAKVVGTSFSCSSSNTRLGKNVQYRYETIRIFASMVRPRRPN